MQRSVAAAYKTAFRTFKRAFPWVKSYAPWNEANHVSQPTSKSPKRAAQYYDVLRKKCKGCKVLAADVLDQSNVTTWLNSFIRYSHNRGRSGACTTTRTSTATSPRA